MADPTATPNGGGFLTEASTLQLLTPAVATDPETAHVPAPGASGSGRVRPCSIAYGLRVSLTSCTFGLLTEDTLIAQAFLCSHPHKLTQNQLSRMDLAPFKTFSSRSHCRTPLRLSFTASTLPHHFQMVNGQNPSERNPGNVVAGWERRDCRCERLPSLTLQSWHLHVS